MNSSTWPIDAMITGTSIPGQSAAKSNRNKGLLHISLSPNTGNFQSNAI